jgi:hypothetical protein
MLTRNCEVAKAVIVTVSPRHRVTCSAPETLKVEQQTPRAPLITATYEHYDGTLVERILAPYSLVNKSSHWYLVALRDGELRTYRVIRFHEVRLLPETFVRRTDFDLATYWQEQLASFVASFSEYRCTLRIHPERVPFAKWLMVGRWESVSQPNVRVCWCLALASRLLFSIRPNC